MNSTMNQEILHIKNMVCARCVKVVKDEIEKLNISIKHIELGKVILLHPVNEVQLEQIKSAFKKEGFELIEEKNQKIVEKIKTLIIDLIHNTSQLPMKQNYSKYLSDKIGKDYSYLSALFSSVENITIEKYIILQKIELVKELLVYNELTISEIAYKIDYSSVQHLSNQFKSITGLTPSHFKKIGENRRNPLDKIN